MKFRLGPEAPNSASRTPGFRISSTPPRGSMHTGESGGSDHGTSFASIKPAITRRSIAPSTSSFRGWLLRGNSPNLYAPLGGGEDSLATEPDRFVPAPVDPLNRYVAGLGFRNCRQTLVAVATVGRCEHLD